MSKTNRKKLYWIISIVAFLFIAIRVYFSATDDFRLSNITYEMPYQETWEVAPLTSEQETQIQQILTHEFSYIGKGAQSYAFGSDDGQYVLKFFKFKHLRPSWFHAWLPSIGFIKDYKDKQAAAKRRKLYGVFQGYKLAYDVHKNESGLLFIQLNIKNNPKRSVTLRDKIGFKRHVDLENVAFILQKKGQTLRTILTRLLNAGDVAGAQEHIGKIFDLYSSEYHKGIYDHDHGVMYNTGFVGEFPIHLDVGKMVKDDTMRDKKTAVKDAHLVAFKMKAWISQHYPQYNQQLSDFIEKKIEGI